VTGLIFIGPPGAAKTALAKAAGTTLGVPTIALDLGGMKGSLVGESEQRLRAALKVITAVGNNRALFIATCNSIGNLPPELRRRFTRGTFFFDLPTSGERKAIWALYAKKFDLTAAQMADMPNDTDWTGAEIKQCASMAWDMGLTLREAAEYVVPVATSAKESIARLRSQATGRFISASQPGVYMAADDQIADQPVPAKPQRSYADV
jgi:SpoVK/Ycf46/Vps4 family AAA+-type ATPase